jgi:xylulokinase
MRYKAVMPAVTGVDIGTSSSKGVLVDLDGRGPVSHVVEHAVQRPGPGRFETDRASRL